MTTRSLLISPVLSLGLMACAAADGDVRLDSVTFGERTLRWRWLEPVARARILIDDGVDAERGGHNFASGQGIHSANDDWEEEGPATITPTGRDLRDSLANPTGIAISTWNSAAARLDRSRARRAHAPAAAHERAGARRRRERRWARLQGHRGAPGPASTLSC